MKQAVTEAAIIRAFKDAKGLFVSGEDLAAIIGMSRAAIWKHIEALREKGYEIEALPRRGYRLLSIPDMLLPEEITSFLVTRMLGSRIRYYSRIGSTNKEAKKLAEEGAEEGVVVVAEEQTDGKGRLDRCWVSPSGGVWMSLVLRPQILPAQVTRFAILTAVSVAKTIEMLGVTPQIKWPNDILVDGKKICGILLESSAQPDRVAYIVIGIGVNANIKVDDIPEEIRHRATSLSEKLDKNIDRSRFAADLLFVLEQEYDNLLSGGWDSIKNAWMSRCTMLGRQITLSMLTGDVTGTFVGIDEYGALLLESLHGVVNSYAAGDVTVKKQVLP